MTTARIWHLSSISWSAVMSTYGAPSQAVSLTCNAQDSDA